MPRPEDGRGGHGRPRAVLRGACFVIAAALGVLAIWLIVTGTTEKSTRIGALVGFWAVLMAAFPVFGSRHPHAVDQQDEVRPSTGLERVGDAAERREYEYRLQQMLRREIHAALGPELASLRSDIAALRSELVEKVGGQLRLERIETTRVIGSDIEALQHEVRQLKNGRQLGSFALGTTTSTSYVQSMDDRVVGEPVPAGPAANGHPADHWDAEVVDEETTWSQASVIPATAPPVAEPAPPPAAAPAPVPPRIVLPSVAFEPFVVQPAVEPEPEPFEPEPVLLEPVPASPRAAPEPAPWPEPIRNEPEPAPSPADEPEPIHLRAADPFAALPRIRPFSEFELDPIESAPPPEPEPINYAGRRRDEAGAPPVPSSGRHSGADEAAIATPRPGGRRRRDGDGEEGHDVLAQILAREGTRD